MIKKKKKEETDANVNEVLPQELHKPLIKKIKGNNVLTRYKDNISEADLAEMGSLSSFNHGVLHLSCAIHVFTKYAWVKSLNDKKFKTILNSFIEILAKFKCKPNKLWVDQGRFFYNTFMQKTVKEY